MASIGRSATKGAGAVVSTSLVTQTSTYFVEKIAVRGRRRKDAYGTSLVREPNKASEDAVDAWYVA